MQKHLNVSPSSIKYLISRLKKYEEMARNNSWNTPTTVPIDLVDCLRALIASGNKSSVEVLTRYLSGNNEVKPALEVIKQLGKGFPSLEESLFKELEYGVNFAEKGYNYIRERLLDPELDDQEKKPLLYFLFLNKTNPSENLSIIKDFLLSADNLSGLLVQSAFWALPKYKNDLKKLNQTQLKQHTQAYKQILVESVNPKLTKYCAETLDILRKSGFISTRDLLSVLQEADKAHASKDIEKTLKIFLTNCKRRLTLENKQVV